MKNKKIIKNSGHKLYMNNAGGPQKTDGLITKNFRYFAFSRVFFRSESKSKTPAISETEFFVTLANG